MTPKSMPIIVGGFYRSGTTLLRRILDAHSSIHCGPEVKFMKDFFGDYRDDQLAHARFFATSRSYGIGDDWLLAHFGRSFVGFHEHAAHSVGKPRWADKNPENVLFLDAWRKVLPTGFAFVHVVRDPRDALASLQEVGFQRAVPPALAARADLYRSFREAGASYMRANPDTSVEVRYEHLVTSPHECIKSLMQWLGEPFEPAALEAINSPARGSGMEDPKAQLHSTIHSSSVGRGMRDLTPDELLLITTKLAEFVAA